MDLEILRIASDNNNNKYIQNHTHHSKLKNPLCGDEMQINLIIDEERIIDFGYQGKCCVYCQASASLLSKISINKKKSKIFKISKNCEDGSDLNDFWTESITSTQFIVFSNFRMNERAKRTNMFGLREGLLITSEG